MTITTEQAREMFPLDWNEWREMWADWRADMIDRGRLARSSYRFPPKNFLADEVLGTWRVDGPNGGQNVELSEVTFPALGRDGQASRYVGVTYGTGAGTCTPADYGREGNSLCASFAQLERELFGEEIPRGRGATR